MGGRRYLDAANPKPLHERQTWSKNGIVLQKPLGWSRGFLKEETQFTCATVPGVGLNATSCVINEPQPFHPTDAATCP